MFSDTFFPKQGNKWHKFFCIIMALIFFKSGDVWKPQKVVILTHFSERGADPIHDIKSFASMT